MRLVLTLACSSSFMTVARNFSVLCFSSWSTFSSSRASLTSSDSCNSSDPAPASSRALESSASNGKIWMMDTWTYFRNYSKYKTFIENPNVQSFGNLNLNHMINITSHGPSLLSIWERERERERERGEYRYILLKFSIKDVRTNLPYVVPMIFQQVSSYQLTNAPLNISIKSHF